MLLTEDNFIEHFDKGEVFYIANDRDISRCEPIFYKTERFADLKQYVIDNKTYWFNQKLMSLDGSENRFKQKRVWSTYDEAIVRMRELFIEWVEEGMNTSVFKKFPIVIEK